MLPDGARRHGMSVDALRECICGAHTRQMRANEVLGAVVAAILALLMVACGSEVTGAADRSERGTDEDGTSSGDSSGSQREQITPGGIAVVVLEHLGQDAVRKFVAVSPDEEPGTVGVMVQLRERTPHNFGVQVYSPEQAEEFGAECGQERGMVSEERCRTLEDGTVISMREIAEGFSDDNADGSVLLGSVVTPEDGAVLSMFESYDGSPEISSADLEALITDSRLTWLTDPAVNEAGEAVDMHEANG